MIEVVFTLFRFSLAFCFFFSQKWMESHSAGNVDPVELV